MADISPIDLQAALKGADYPATGDDLARLAEQNRADESLVQQLRSLPDGIYDGPDAVSQEVYRTA